MELAEMATRWDELHPTLGHSESLQELHLTPGFSESLRDPKKHLAKGYQEPLVLGLALNLQVSTHPSAS
jgi:hypothetical protein